MVSGDTPHFTSLFRFSHPPYILFVKNKNKKTSFVAVALCGYSKKIRKTAIEGLLPAESSRILSLGKKQKLN